jgi:hypothetical protein
MNIGMALWARICGNNVGNVSFASALVNGGGPVDAAVIDAVLAYRIDDVSRRGF